MINPNEQDWIRINAEMSAIVHDFNQPHTVNLKPSVLERLWMFIRSFNRKGEAQ